MNKASKKILSASVAILVLLIAIAWMAGFFNRKVAPGLDVIVPTNNTEAFTVMASNEPIIESVPAAVAAKQTTLISSRLIARIIAINARAGDNVNEGQLLIELEKNDLVSRAQQSQEQIKVIEARLVEASANLERAKKLVDDGSIAASDFDKIRAIHDSLTAELSSAQLALQEAQTGVSYTEIRAPIAGRIVDRFAEPGNTATPGVTLLSLYNPLALRVEAQVREQLALTLEVGRQVGVEIPSLKKSLQGEIEELVPAASPGSRSFLVKVRVQAADNLLPGMYARLLLPSGEQQRISIPNRYLATAGQLNVVWVLSEGVSQQRFVKVGRVDTERQQTEIISGLSEGEEIVPVP
ncbi:efflux RND transporter periplasmic adaptor subunit [Aurantivibrio infirmus]